MRTSPTLFYAFVCAIFAALFYVVASYTTGIVRDIAAVLGVVFGAFALAFGLDYVIYRLPRLLSAAAGFIERVAYYDKDVKLAAVIASMSTEQLRVWEHEMYQLIEDADKLTWIIRKNGIELSPEWIKGFMYKCDSKRNNGDPVFFPEFPALRRLPNGSIMQNEESAFVAYAVDMRWAMKREGQTAVWINGWTPMGVLDYWNIRRE